MSTPVGRARIRAPARASSRIRRMGVEHAAAGGHMPAQQLLDELWNDLPR